MNTYHLLTLTATAVVGGILGVAVNQALTPQIVTVNITELVDTFVNNAAQEKLSQEELQVQVGQFSQKMEQSIDRIARKKHVIIMPKEAVMAGAKDITDELDH